MSPKQRIKLLQKVDDSLEQLELNNAMNTRNLESLLMELVERFKDAKILSAAKEYQRVLDMLRTAIDEDRIKNELDMLVSASTSIHGLSDMCPEGYDYAKWVKLIDEIRKETVFLREHT